MSNGILKNFGFPVKFSRLHGRQKCKVIRPGRSGLAGIFLHSAEKVQFRGFCGRRQVFKVFDHEPHKFRRPLEAFIFYERIKTLPQGV
jgi:hypothetical protein